jgi:(p)ppGpp synthase/HD superfamily hydrolase
LDKGRYRQPWTNRQQRYAGRIRDMEIKTLAKAERKQRQIETASKKSPQAKLIKLADKISNVKDLGESSPAGWPAERQLDYLEWTRQVVHNLRGVNDALDQLYDSTLETARILVNRR